MSELVLALLTWIAMETGLLMPPSPPVVLASVDEMRERAGGSHSVVALYDRDTATIYLPANWDRTRTYDRAMLLHELVHHVQEFNRIASRCAAERERQAYDLTVKWLAAQGIADPYAVLNTDELTIAIFSMCVPPEE